MDMKPHDDLFLFINLDDFELLCPNEDGVDLERRPVTEFESCSWGVAPGRSVVVSSAMEMADRLGTSLPF